MVGDCWVSWESCGGFVADLVLLPVDCQSCLESCLESCVCTLSSGALFHMSWLGMVGNRRESCGGFVANLVLLPVDCQSCLESCVCTLSSCALFHMSWLGMVGNRGNRAVDL